jgi:phosphopantetheinyl transferase
MPLLFEKNINAQTKLAVWNIEESEEWFIERLWLCREELLELDALKGKKRLEWLADRYVLHELIGEQDRFPCIKDEFGKPFLEGSDWQISLSNSANRAAAIVSKNPTGLDIQYLTEKIKRIAPKFMRNDEFLFLDKKNELEHLHVFWGAKEALYKAYGKRELDFKKHIILSPFEYDLSVGKCFGKVEKDDFQANFEIFYEKNENFILVSAIEINKTFSFFYC